jgi:orotate phosphoribosyltransferase
VQADVLSLVGARKGHFLLESGHHGDLWLDLELLCLRPRHVQPFAAALAKRLASFHVQAVCGPLVEGAFVGLMVASELGVEFSYAERYVQPTGEGLFPVRYRIPEPLRGRVRDKRVAIVNDVINAGSAVRGTVSDLETCGATLVAIGTLVVLGMAASEFAASKGVALESLASHPNTLWEPAKCPLCASGVRLEDIADFATVLAVDRSKNEAS